MAQPNPMRGTGGPNPPEMPIYQKFFPELRQAVQDDYSFYAFAVDGTRVTVARIDDRLMHYHRQMNIDRTYRDAPPCVRNYQVEKWVFRCICEFSLPIPL